MTSETELARICDAPSGFPGGASWRPILGDLAASRALRAVDELAAWLAVSHDQERGDPSLSAGSAGVSLLFAHLAAAGGGKPPAAVARRHLEEAVEVLSTAPLGASLYAGFTGIAWAAEVLDQLLDAGGEDRNEAIDDALLMVLRTGNFAQAPYDLIHGLTGLGVYALDRWPSPAAAQCVAHAVDHLAKLARHDETGTYWWTGPSLLLGPRRKQYPQGGVDLGVAHGIAGVIPFLARASTLGAAQAPALLEGAVRWLLAHAVPSEAGPTMPYFVAEGVEAQPARSAWCYGDPGVAAALLAAAREVGEPAWQQAATDLAIRAADRPPKLTGVTDAGFCHGSAGLAHLFNRMHQMTGEKKLADAALFWLDRTLELVAAADPDGTAASTEVNRHLPWNGRGVLEGAAGIGLVLLAASTGVEPAWDRMFLLSRLAPHAVGART